MKGDRGRHARTIRHERMDDVSGRGSVSKLGSKSEAKNLVVGKYQSRLVEDKVGFTVSGGKQDRKHGAEGSF
jgi:hypothetical protein